MKVKNQRSKVQSLDQIKDLKQNLRSEDWWKKINNRKISYSIW